MLYGPPTLPATGGGLIVSVAGLIYGSIIGNWIVVILSMVMIIIIRALIRLRRGEQEIRKRDQ